MKISVIWLVGCVNLRTHEVEIQPQSHMFTRRGGTFGYNYLSGFVMEGALWFLSLAM